MAFIFAGKGIRELQEGDAVSLTPLPGPTWEWLGVYPTMETMLAQGVLLALLAFALMKTVMARRARELEAAIAAMSAPAAVMSHVPQAVIERVRELEELAVTLRARVEVLESALGFTRDRTGCDWRGEGVMPVRTVRTSLGCVLAVWTPFVCPVPCMRHLSGRTVRPAGG